MYHLRQQNQEECICTYNLTYIQLYGIVEIQQEGSNFWCEEAIREFSPGSTFVFSFTSASSLIRNELCLNGVFDNVLPSFQIPVRVQDDAVNIHGSTQNKYLLCTFATAILQDGSFCELLGNMMVIWKWSIISLVAGSVWTVVHFFGHDLNHIFSSDLNLALSKILNIFR